VTPERLRSLLLKAGAGSPLIAIGCLCLAIAAYPHFNNATQYLSELGSGGHDPTFFNLALIVAALGGAVVGAGFALAVPALGGGRIAGFLVAVCFWAAAVGLIAGIVFVYPNPWHNLIQLGLGIQLAPFVLLIALWRVRGIRLLYGFLIAAAVVMAALTVLTKHIVWPDLVNGDNVGWWERAYAIVLVGWGGVAAVLIERRLITLAARTEA
jgi:glucan biosynthesis protein C